MKIAMVAMMLKVMIANSYSNKEFDWASFVGFNWIPSKTMSNKMKP